jgi:hypothetical protein
MMRPEMPRLRLFRRFFSSGVSTSSAVSIGGGGIGAGSLGSGIFGEPMVMNLGCFHFEFHSDAEGT